MKISKRLVLLCVAALSATTAYAEETYNFELWRPIVVQQGGRMKPLDTLAWEFVLSVTNTRGSLKPDSFFSISVGDIPDFPAFIEALKAAEKSDASPAAQRIFKSLSNSLKSQMATLPFAEKGKFANELQLVNANVEVFKKKYSTGYDIQTIDQLRNVAAGDKEVADLLAKQVELTKSLLAINNWESKLILELNDLVSWKDLYTPEAWPSADLPKDAQEFVEKGIAVLSNVELQRLNSLLVHAAFPKTVSEMPLGTAEVGQLAIEARRYSALELYVTWLLGWQGWDKVGEYAQLGEGRDDEIYWRFHTADVWDHQPMINARFEMLKPELKPETLTAVSPRTVANNKDFEKWVMEAVRKRRAEEVALTTAEEKGLEVFEAYLNYAQLRLGFNLQVGPTANDDPTDTDAENQWIPLVALLIKNDRIDQIGYDKQALEDVRSGFKQARLGLLTGKPAEFNAGSAKFAGALAKLGEKSKLYPTAAAIQREVHYNEFEPFLKTTVVAFAAAVILALSLMTQSRIPYHVGFVTFLAAMGLSAYGMALRVMISGRGPVTNMYETIIWATFICAVLSVILATTYKESVIALVGAVTLGLGTLLAYNLPAEMGLSITPLVPVLRSNYWLVVHVMTIVASYGAFMLAWALGNLGLGYYAANVQKPELHKRMGMLIYRAMQVGVLLLAVGTILGGWWAAESWGRFWGWDPKEVWALIALLLYLAILHARYAGWVKLFGLHAWTVVAFSGVVMAWYGVNFVLGAGLHAYAFGSGGRIYVVGALVLNLAYVIGVAILHSSRLGNGSSLDELRSADEHGDKELVESTAEV